MASPAEIANDMAAHATYWAKRDKRVFAACRDAERVIRAYLAGERVDGRTRAGVWRRLLQLEDNVGRWQAYPNFFRARNCISSLSSEATAK